MNKPIIIIGRSCSGKDTIVNSLVQKYGYEKIITYTTRPMRPGEKQDKTYYFSTEQEFLDKVKSGFFAEYKKYDTEFGPWYYGVAMEDILNAKENSIVILTPAGFYDVKKQLPEEPISFYVTAPDSVLLKRQKRRNDDEKEAKRRFDADALDFANIDETSVTKVINNDGYLPVEAVVHIIHKEIQDVLLQNTLQEHAK